MKIDKLQEGLELIRSDDLKEFDKFFNQLDSGDKFDFPRICAMQNINKPNSNINLEKYQKCKIK